MRSTLYRITGPWLGCLAIVPRPRGGDWLEDEVKSQRSEGVDVLVSTLTGEEAAEWELGREAEWCRENGIDFISLPIEDRGVPSSAATVAAVLRPLERRLAEGKSVAVHCRQGIGRSALVSACLLALGGVGVEEAFRRIAVARGCPVPETAGQREWAERFAREQLSAVSTD